MKPRDFLRKLDDAQVVAAIQAAENSTSGEIRVFVTNRSVGPEEVVRRATVRFKKLGMTKTHHRNAILLYFAPRARQFAVVGDERIHAKCGHVFWNEVVARTCATLRKGEFTGAVVDAIGMAGKVLARHFPRLPDDRNELPNEVGRD